MERQTLSGRTADRIFDLIQQGGYNVGDKLPTEAQLVERMAVSRNTIREALRILASRNIVDIRQGAGCFLSDKLGVAEDPLGLSLVEDRRKLTRELLQVRLMIEPEIAALAAQNAAEQEIKRLEELYRELQLLAARGSDFSQNDQQFHALLAECTHNEVITKLLPVITEGVAVYSGEVHTQEFLNTVKCHGELVEAVRLRQPMKAREVMLFHLLFNQRRFEEE